MATVVCTGSNRILMQTRVMILQKAGHSVIGTMNEHELIEACKSNPVDVVVVGQGISPVQKNRVLILARAHCPAALVLELYQTTQGRVLGDADDWLEVPGEFPQHLAERVTELARRKGASKAS